MFGRGPDEETIGGKRGWLLEGLASLKEIKQIGRTRRVCRK